MTGLFYDIMEGLSKRGEDGQAVVEEATNDIREFVIECYGTDGLTEELQRLSYLLVYGEKARTNIYAEIKSAWASAGSEIPTPEHLKPFQDEAYRLDKILAKRFEEPLQMYSDGLINTTELLDKLIFEAMRPE